MLLFANLQDLHCCCWYGSCSKYKGSISLTLMPFLLSQKTINSLNSILLVKPINYLQQQSSPDHEVRLSLDVNNPLFVIINVKNEEMFKGRNRKEFLCL